MANLPTDVRGGDEASVPASRTRTRDRSPCAVPGHCETRPCRGAAHGDCVSGAGEHELDGLRRAVVNDSCGYSTPCRTPAGRDDWSMCDSSTMRAGAIAMMSPGSAPGRSSRKQRRYASNPRAPALPRAARARRTHEAGCECQPRLVPFRNAARSPARRMRLARAKSLVLVSALRCRRRKRVDSRIGVPWKSSIAGLRPAMKV